jgi:ATP-dependent Clp protease ATP-binding subunit ClpC
MNTELDLKSLRARRAKMGARIGKRGEQVLRYLGIILVAGSSAGFVAGFSRASWLSLGVGLLASVVSFWHRYDLAALKVRSAPKQLDDILAGDLLAELKAPLTPETLWLAATRTNAGRFVVNKVFIHPDDVAALLSKNEEAAGAIWQAALQLRGNSTKELHGGTVAAVVLSSLPETKAFLAHYNLRPEDVLEVHSWVNRLLSYIDQPKPYFGGIGRDWATGFTPTLEHFSHNLSLSIEAGGGYFHTLAHGDLMDTIVHGLSQGSGSVALIGDVGTGKTSLVYGLAERLLTGQDKSLEHYQVVGLNASMILSTDKRQLEGLMLTLFNEAVKAGNIILFLDDAELFFGDGLGAFNMTQILLPVLQSRKLKVIAAFTPHDYQKLRASSQAVADSFATVSVKEPDQPTTMNILEDSALSLEGKSKLLVTYDAVREAYRLSGQYMSDRAYPGKAIDLLEHAAPYATDKVMLAKSVQAAVEKTLGVKAGTAQGAEADTLLQLEDRIHERMINQVQAVNAVAAALRRVRAGVASPNRPAGSFLFLGPTGVGKTELARSLAAVYFGDAHQMIRLDMTEYQQPSDVSRLLSDASGAANSLILSIRKQPFSVVLLDEVEKAHPDVLNLLLQLLDEGQLTDSGGRPASFKESIIIATSNAGATDIINQLGQGSSLENFQRPLIDKLIQSGQFKPELVNRFDEVVLFRPLNESELMQVARLMLQEVNKNLSNKNISLELTEAAMKAIVQAGYDPQFGARPMRRVIQQAVEDVVATKILQGQAQAGTLLRLDVTDLKLPAKQG